MTPSPMRRLPSTQDFADDHALRYLARGDRVIYERHVAAHPNFASMDGQALPDAVYIEASQRWPGDTAEAQHARTVWLQARIHEAQLRRLSVEAKPAPIFTRGEAVLHTLCKSVVPSAIAVFALWELTGPVNGAVALSFATVLCAIRLTGALLTRHVF